MRQIRFFFALLLTTGLTILASLHQPLGSPLPAIGQFLSPFTGFWQNAERADKFPDENLVFPQLSAQSEALFDERGVPHIFAQSNEDAAFIQGYIHARDRLWQMDISVRATIGRLSEVMGERTLERDRVQRRKGLLWGAENALKKWMSSPEEAAIINAYCEGTNAYINSLSPADYPIEFKLLGYAPEPWTPLHIAAFYKSMSEALCSRHEDIPATNARLLLGDSLFQVLYPEHNPKQSPIIPDVVQWDFNPLPLVPSATGDSMLSSGATRTPFELPSPFIGSNNWAVSAEKTANGAPILCNDPHLQLRLPAVWYEVQMQTPDYNAYGVSFPGVPGIIIGFNKDMAWGVTNVGHDVLDWYRIDWANPEKTAYRIDGEEKPVREVVEVIQVKGRDEPLLDTVRYTIWGPVTYDDPEHPQHDMAMRWLAHDEPAEKPFYALGVFTRLMGGQGLSDYQAALRGWESPAQNFVFACKANDIAITVNGKLPLKEDQQGRFVQDGSRSESGWKGFIPHEHLPSVVNPERGFVSSANQRSTAPDYPYYYNGGFDDYRGRYINRRLAEMENITVEDMKALQLDSRSLKPEDALPVLLQLLDSTASELRAHERVKTLRNWDYNFTRDAEAPSLFEDWFEAAYAHAFDEFTVWEDSLEVLQPEEWRFIELLATQPGHAIFDHQSTPEVETAAEVVLMALKKALEQPPVSWAAHKSTDIGHMAMIPAFSRLDLDVGGYGDAPNAIKPEHGPSWRMVVELGEQPNAWGVFPGGPSGNPGSAFYDPMVTPWVEGQYNRLHLLDSPDDPAVKPLYRLTFKTAE